MTSRRCVHCGARLRGAPAFCPSCGTHLVRADGPEVELDLLDRERAPMVSEVVFERPAGRRGRTIGLGVAAALAVAIGASVLSGGDDDSATPVTTTIDPGPTTAVDPPPTTMTDGAASGTSTTVGPFAVAPGPLLGEPTGLSLAVALGTDLYLLDADTGTATPVGFTEIAEGQGAVLTAVGVVALDANGTPDLLRPGAAATEPLVDTVRTETSGAVGPVTFVGEGPAGRLWFIRYEGVRSSVAYLDATAAPTALTVVGDLDPVSGVARPDGIGGFLFTAPGGTYRYDEDGAVRRISTGQLLDASAGHALVVECDEALVCAFRGIDLASGASWTAAAAERAGVGDLFGVALSPDGRRFARLVSPGPDELTGIGADVTIEVTGAEGTETFREEAAAFGACGFGGCLSPMSWSPDGRWLFSLRSSASLWAWRSGLDEPVVIELPAVVPARQASLSVLIGARPTASMPVAPAPAS